MEETVKNSCFTKLTINEESSLSGGCPTPSMLPSPMVVLTIGASNGVSTPGQTGGFTSSQTSEGISETILGITEML